MDVLHRSLSLIAAIVACGSPAPPARGSPVRDTPSGGVDAGVEAGWRATRDERVTKQPAQPDSCWLERSCSGGRVCKGPEDPTFSACPVRGCRERAEHDSCTANVDCLAGYSCVLGPSEWHGSGDTWHCERIRCKADADCLSANLHCGSGGLCAPIDCTKSSDCDGYCLGTCWAKPGTCVVPQRPEMRP